MADSGGRLLAGIAGSNIADGMDVCPVSLYAVLSSAGALQGDLQGVCQK